MPLPVIIRCGVSTSLTELNQTSGFKVSNLTNSSRWKCKSVCKEWKPQSNYDWTFSEFLVISECIDMSVNISDLLSITDIRNMLKIPLVETKLPDLHRWCCINAKSIAELKHFGDEPKICAHHFVLVASPWENFIPWDKYWYEFAKFQIVCNFQAVIGWSFGLVEMLCKFWTKPDSWHWLIKWSRVWHIPRFHLVIFKSS